MFSVIASSQVVLKLKIVGLDKNGGKVYVSIFNSNTSYKARESCNSFMLDAKDDTLSKDMKLPAGQYVFSIYQDSNGNGKLDTNRIGIPREKFGFSNYDGKSAPGGFNRHKVQLYKKVNELVLTLVNI